MTNVQHKNSSYILIAENIHIDKNKYIPAKFDTGAIKTIISLDAIYDTLLTDDYIDRVSEILKSKTRAAEFSSASGHSITGFLTYQDNVKLSNLEVPRLYYYLTMQRNVKRFLLGDDFISFCRFEHDKNSDIIISKFYYHDYIEQIKKSDKLKDCLSVDEIVDIIGRNHSINNVCQTDIFPIIKNLKQNNKI